MATDTMEAGVLEAIEAIRPALQADGGDIVFKRIDDDGVVLVELVGACGDLPGVDDDPQGRRRADHHGPGARGSPQSRAPTDRHAWPRGSSSRSSAPRHRG